MEMNWSRWFHCESSFGLLLVPSQPGVFALAEEVVQPGPASRRMLAVFEVAEADDLSRAMSRLFATGNPLREKLLQARCYIRYAIAPSIADRRAAATALKNWLSAQQEVASQVLERPVNVPSELELAIAPAQVLARPEQRSGATREMEAAHPAKAMAAAAVPDYSESESGGQKTVAERAVDRVTHGVRLSKAVSAGF